MTPLDLASLPPGVLDRLDSFRANIETRQRIAKRIKALQPQASNRQIARTLGVHHDTVDRDVGGSPPVGGKDASRNNGLKMAAGGNPPPSLSGPAAARLVERLILLARRPEPRQ